MDLFTLAGKISVESTDALTAIGNVMQKAQELYNYINGTTGTIHVKDETATSKINKALQEIDKLYKRINSTQGTVNVNNSTALTAISGVSTAITNVYSLINTNTGIINVDTSGASTKIEQLKLAAQEVAGYLGGSTAYVTDNAGVAGAIGKGGLVGTTDWGTILAKGKTLGKKILKGSETAVGAAGAVGIYKALSETKDFFQAGYEYNTFAEVQKAKFKTLLQTTPEGADTFFGGLEQFAIDSPLTLEGVMEAATKLLGIGIDQSAIVPTLEMLGDISLGDATTMERIAKAYTDVMANTTLLAQEGRQFTEAGTPIWRLLEEYYATKEGHNYSGLSAADLKAQNKKESPIPYEDVLAALQMATGEGGMFYDAINIMMGTTDGQAEKMKDNYRRTAGKFTEAFVSVFTKDTIPALNGILDKLNVWANTNPEALDKLASAFSTLATEGIGGLLDALTNLVSFYSSHSSQLNTLVALVGTLLMFNGAPKTGLAMITLATAGTMANAKDEWGKDITGENDGGLAKMLLSEEAQAILAAGGTKDDLSEGQQKRYDIGEALYGTYDRLTGLGKLLFGPDYDPRNGVGDGLLSFLVKDGDATEEATDTTEEKEGFSFWQMMFPGFAGAGETFESLLDALIPKAGAEEADYGNQDGTGSAGWNPGFRDLYNDPRFSLDGFGSSGGTNTLQGMFASLPAQIEAAAREGAAAGCAEGVGNIAVTGNVTTGNVVLDTGAIVGQLAPRMNLVLGGLNMISGRG